MGGSKSLTGDKENPWTDTVSREGESLAGVPLGTRRRVSVGTKVHLAQTHTEGKSF